MGNSVYSGPLGEALLAIDRGDPILWATPLVDALERQSPGRALLWAAAMIGELSSQVVDDNRRALMREWLDRLDGLQNEDAAGRLLDLSRVIWYCNGERDELQTAIARLYEALGALQTGHEVGYRRTTAGAIEVAVSDPHDPFRRRDMQRLIESFREWYERGPSSASDGS